MVLEKAGVRECFETVQANPFIWNSGYILGSVSYLVSAEDKLSMAKSLVGGTPGGIVAVGDGYTDLPLLDWVQWPALVDPDGAKQSKYTGKPYHFIPSITALPRLLTQF